jgi:hypothetical protein
MPRRLAAFRPTSLSMRRPSHGDLRVRGLPEAGNQFEAVGFTLVQPEASSPPFRFTQSSELASDKLY